MTTIGTRVYGLGAITLGVPGLIAGNFAVMGLPVSPQLPSYAALAYASAALLVLAGVAINLPRATAFASPALAVFFVACTLALHVPRAVAEPMVWVSWEGLAEILVMAIGGVLAYAMTRSEPRAAAIRRFAVPSFGICLVVFGISEFVYAKFTGAMVPAWLPPSQLFWTYLTGAAHIAAGLAVLSRVKARLAAVLLTGMYLAFSLLVHLPRVIAAPSSAASWGENGFNLVLAGAAWVLAETLAARMRHQWPN